MNINKFKSFLTENLQTKERVMLSALAGFTFSFIFIVYGMLYMYISNYNDFVNNVPFKTILSASCAVFFAVWLFIFILTIILPGKIYTVALSLLTGLFAAGVIQRNFLNNSAQLGELTGDYILWHNYSMQTLVNTLLWLFIFVLPVLIRYFSSAKVWKSVILYTCILFSGTQMVTLAAAYLSSRDVLHYTPEFYLSREGAYEVSSAGNIFIFVVDRLDYTYVENVRENDPAFFDRLDGFTDFNNAAAVYEATFPAGVLMTTGIPHDFEKTRAEYFDYAWNNSDFISILKKNNYTMKYHMDSGYMYTDYGQIKNAADNLKDGKIEPGIMSVISNFLNLSAYSYAPAALKPTFFMPVVEFEITDEISPEEYVSADDPLFMRLLQENGLTIRNNKNNYYYLHLNGSHAPYTMDENAVYAGETDVVTQTKGCFNILYAYMDELKKLGVYEDSTIIILGDHGWDAPGTTGFQIGFFVKPKGSAGTPLVTNNAPVSISDNFIATILASEGIENDLPGISAFDVPRDTPGERYIVRYSETGEELEYYRITGHISDKSNWVMTDSRNFLVNFATGLPVE